MAPDKRICGIATEYQCSPVSCETVVLRCNEGQDKVSGHPNYARGAEVKARLHIYSLLPRKSCDSLRLFRLFRNSFPVHVPRRLANAATAHTSRIMDAPSAGDTATDNISEMVRAPPSKLLALPAELRLLIYEAAFPPRSTEMYFNNDTMKLCSDIRFTMSPDDAQFCGLLMSCKKVRAEALPILYRDLTFDFYCPLFWGGDRLLSKEDELVLFSRIQHAGIDLAWCKNSGQVQVLPLIFEVHQMPKLRSLKVVLQKDLHKAWQRSWEEVVQGLSAMRTSARIEVWRGPNLDQYHELTSYRRMLDTIGGYVSHP